MPGDLSADGPCETGSEYEDRRRSPDVDLGPGNGEAPYSGPPAPTAGTAPVLTIPRSYPIAVRPRCEPIYDTEQFTSGSLLTTYSFFQSTRTFQSSGGGGGTTTILHITNGITTIYFDPPNIPGPYPIPATGITFQYTIGGITYTATGSGPGPSVSITGPFVGLGSAYFPVDGSYSLFFTTPPDLGANLTSEPTGGGGGGGPYTSKSTLDTNMPGAGGSIPRGYYFRWFGLNFDATYRNDPGTTGGDFDDLRKIWEASYTTILLGSTPYMYIQTQRVQSSTSLGGPLATHQAGLTTGAVQMGAPNCCCYYDLSVPGKVRKQTPQGIRDVRIARIPIEFAETENFQINVTFPIRPTTTNTIYMTPRMLGIFLKPLTG